MVRHKLWAVRTKRCNMYFLYERKPRKSAKGEWPRSYKTKTLVVGLSSDIYHRAFPETYHLPEGETGPVKIRFADEA